MTNPHTPNAAIAASIPWTMHQLAEFMNRRTDLEGIAEIGVSSSRGHVTIYVDSVWAEDWTDAFDGAPELSERATTGGTHHEAHGILNGVRVAVKWFVLDAVRRTPRLRLVDEHADAFHVPCEGHEEAAGHVILCLDEATVGHGGTVERACRHHRALCEACRFACAECVDDARQDGTGRP